LMADSVYSDWAFRNTETVSPCRPVIVALDGEAVMGFLAAEFDKETARAEIVLNGVVPKCRSRGVYSDLLLSGLQVAKAKGCQHTEVSTQLINVAVQRVWTRFGFRPSRALYTLHRWYDSG
ncbi:MAG: GNAT family N-acetyltransferase, partial [Pseudomonadota bacterium]